MHRITTFSFSFRLRMQAIDAGCLINLCMRICTRCCAHMHKVLCAHAQDTVRACARYCACMLPILCARAINTVRTCYQYCAHMLPMLCAHATNTLRMCNQYLAHVRPIQVSQYLQKKSLKIIYKPN